MSEVIKVIPVVFGGAANFWVYRLVERRLNLTKKHVLPERYKLVCVSEDHFVTLVSNITDSSALSELDEEERWREDEDSLCRELLSLSSNLLREWLDFLSFKEEEDDCLCKAWEFL